MVKKKFTITKEEYKEFTNKIMINSKIRILILTGLIVLVGTIVLSLNKGVYEAIINGVSLFTAYMIIVTVGLFGLVPLFSNKAYKKNNIENISFNYEILDTGVKQNKDIYLYDQFVKVVESKLSYFLYLQAKQIILIPKRILSQDEEKYFRNLIKTKIKKTKLKKDQ